MTISVQTRRQQSRIETPSLSKLSPRKNVAKRKRSGLKPTTIALYASVFVAIISLVGAGYSSPQSEMVARSVETAPAGRHAAEHTSVNEVVATVIAANAAEVAQLPIAANVSNLSVSLSATSDIATTANTGGVSKHDIVQSEGDRRSLLTHTVKSGDTVDKLAREYGISAETIKWANDLTSNSLTKGNKITIAPVDGIVYTVRSGDTVEKLAERYKASADRIVAFNDLELSGLRNGNKVIIPAGKLPERERPGYVAPVISTPTSTQPVGWMPMGSTAGNGYAYGYCTWYVKNVRPDLPNQLGNANTWYQRAAAMGLSVGSEPRAGAVFQTAAGGGGYGHVGMIDSVDHANGTVTYSDMNGVAGWNRIGSNTISIAQAKAQWNFIY